MSNRDLTRDGDRIRTGTSPVSIPRLSKYRQNEHGTKSAPSRHAPPFSSLVGPVIEETDVMIPNSVRSDYTSTMKRRKEAEMGEFNAQLYGATNGGECDAGEIHIPPELEQSAEIAEDYVKIASRNKRAEHATTYISMCLNLHTPCPTCALCRCRMKFLQQPLIYQLTCTTDNRHITL